MRCSICSARVGPNLFSIQFVLAKKCGQPLAAWSEGDSEHRPRRGPQSQSAPRQSTTPGRSPPSPAASPIGIIPASRPPPMSLLPFPLRWKTVAGVARLKRSRFSLCNAPNSGCCRTNAASSPLHTCSGVPSTAAVTSPPRSPPVSTIRSRMVSSRSNAVGRSIWGTPRPKPVPSPAGAGADRARVAVGEVARKPRPRVSCRRSRLSLSTDTPASVGDP